MEHIVDVLLYHSQRHSKLNEQRLYKVKDLYMYTSCGKWDEWMNDVYHGLSFDKPLKLMEYLIGSQRNRLNLYLLNTKKDDIHLMYQNPNLPGIFGSRFDIAQHNIFILHLFLRKHLICDIQINSLICFI